ncbi:MAG: carbon-nitrogen hydrolase family protein [Sinobacteraceae bacterium]|nr:carbon-nitrogen hydrolase family protein [Nevskiaceae bacterium]
MIVAALQMTSGADVAANLAMATQLATEAAAQGARVLVLPENFAFMGRRDADKLAVAEPEGEGPIQQALAALAQCLGVWIVGGTLPLATADPQQVAAACLVYDADGRQVARYDKIHLFDVDLPAQDERYRESAFVAAGDTPCVIDTPAGRLGLAVCYDMRFPELFRRMAGDGAQWFVLPSAFTVPTGRAHWETLLRARAIENLAFVVAAAQWGRHEGGRETWGDSLIVDHWGTVLARRREGVGVVCADLDLAAQAEARTRFPVLQHRRL